MDFKQFLKKTWHFIWEDDSIWSWIINVILAFVIIKFLVYPGLGFIMQTSYPIVAVVSGSMEHKTTHPCLELDMLTNQCKEFDKKSYVICGKSFEASYKVDFEFFWQTCSEWYSLNTEIKKEDFMNFYLKDGFNKGDIIMLKGLEPSDVKTGDVIVYMSKTARYPIIHRVVSIKQENNETFSFLTKGDHNNAADSAVEQNQIIGRAVFRIPLLGWIKIGAVDLLNFFKGA